MIVYVNKQTFVAPQLIKPASFDRKAGLFNKGLDQFCPLWCQTNQNYMRLGFNIVATRNENNQFKKSHFCP